MTAAEGASPFRRVHLRLEWVDDDPVKMMEEAMFAIRKAALAPMCAMAIGGGAYAASDWLKGSTEDQLENFSPIFSRASEPS